jgi:acetylornithine/succinyldiaminopimelate/putrescine aminotransferase
MAEVLVLGLDPHAVLNEGADAVRATLDREVERFAEHGIDAAMALVALDDSAGPRLVDALRERPWDVVVVGGGIRKPEPLLEFFEQVVNLVRQHAPQAAIAFNTSGADSVEAALRRLAG